MDEIREASHATTAAWSSGRRWTVGVVTAVVLLGLAVFVPGPIFRAVHMHSAHKLVDEVATGRAELLATQDEIRSPIERLGTPVRSWSEVSCWLAPRYSDGDGEQGLVMFYRQECALVAYEIYALSPDAGDAAQVAARLRGHVSDNPTCGEPILGTLTPDFGASRVDEYDAELWWIDPDATAPADQPERCTLPKPGDADTARVETGVDEPLAADAYILFQVRSPIQSVDVGCERWFAWLGSCMGKPHGLPSLS
ncbi:hypothetical protein [Streptomyces sp. NPDC050560]|uniref:hypothetical protein n=1 Tax=Streptomyces sp. NPDC050560 TaxID=3365630 RepID=UPI0037A657D0